MRGLRALLRQKRSSRAAHEAAPPEAAHQVKRAGEYRQTKREREISSLLPVRSRLPVLDARCVVFAIQGFEARSFSKLSVRKHRESSETCRNYQEKSENHFSDIIVISKRNDIYATSHCRYRVLYLRCFYAVLRSSPYVIPFSVDFGESQIQQSFSN